MTFVLTTPDIRKFSGVKKTEKRMRNLVLKNTMLLAWFVWLHVTTNASMAFTSLDNCEDVSAMYASQFAQELAQESFENIPPILIMWEQTCGIVEPLFRARTLLMIHDGVFTRTNEPEELFDMAVHFEIRNGLMDDEDAEKRDDYFETYKDYFGYVPINSKFDRETRRFARAMLSVGHHDDLVKAVLTLYSGQSSEFFQILRKGKLSGTVVQENYNLRLKELKRKPELNLGISSGIWIPSSDLRAIGSKPFAGVFVGVKRSRITLNAGFEMRFGTVGEEIYVNLRDTMTLVSHYQGGFLGLETTGMLFESGRFRSGLFMAAGYDIIDLVEEGQDPRGKTLYSPSLAAGIFIGYTFPNQTQLSLKPGIQFLNYKNTGGTSFSGNALNLRLVFSYFENASKSQGLKRLGY